MHLSEASRCELDHVTQISTTAAPRGWPGVRREDRNAPTALYAGVPPRCENAKPFS
jgi:hypothetical protein